MTDYDFSSLNDKEFELLTTDVLSQHFNVHIERFKTGKDGGVDGRFFSDPDSEVIIQCKHWLKSGIPALIRSIKKTEAEKVKKLKPSRYIFVTSLNLSRLNKSSIKELFSPYIKSESDVLGNEDINDLLSRYPEVERRHYKLWLTSTNVLKTILNSAIVGRSKYKLEEIVEESNRYVVTKSHREALVKLERIHSIIITGAPGVGKTSLADQLCQFYTANKYEFCYIENSLNEAEDYYKEDEYQVFYFDDFLGRNFLLALDHHQDSHVINFIKRIERDDKKRFILTSRSNVLNQGKRLSDLFEIKNVDRNEYEVSIQSLEDIDKATILYNHIWFGQIKDDFIDEIYKEKRYLKIIKHKNFNPRLISFITDNQRLREIKPEDYWGYIERTLSNPKEIWQNVFDVQIDETSRHVIIAVSIHGQAISETNLKKFYARLISSPLKTPYNRTFDTTVRLLSGALLNRNITDKDLVMYNLFDPSIADYIISEYMDDIDYIDGILTCLETPQAIENIKSLSFSAVFEDSLYSILVEKQLQRVFRSHKSFQLNDYSFKLLSSYTSLTSQHKYMLEYIEKFVAEGFDSGTLKISGDYLEFIYWTLITDIQDNSDQNLVVSIKKWIAEEPFDYEDLVSLSKIISSIECETGELTTAFKEEAINILSDCITSEAIDNGLLSDTFDHDSYYDDEIKNFVSHKLSNMTIGFDQNEIDEISTCCDIDEIIQYNINDSTHANAHYDAMKEEKHIESSSTDAIDELFDRR